MICEICKKEFKNVRGLSSHIGSQHHDFGIKNYYDTYLKKENEGMCEKCGNPTTFYSIKVGYFKNCSHSCGTTSSRKGKIKKIYNMSCKICGKKLQNMRGLMTHLFKSRNHPSTKEYYDLFHKSKEEGKCVACGKDTLFSGLSQGYNKYCCKNCSDNSQVRVEKSKIEMIKKYGENVSCLIWVKEKKKQTFSRHFGCDHWIKDENLKNKWYEKNINIYTDSFFINRMVNGRILTSKNLIYSELEKNNIEVISTFTKCSDLHTVRCLVCGNEFDFVLTRLFRNKHKCLQCNPYYKSSLEKEVYNYFLQLLIEKNLNVRMIRNNRKMLNGKEIDILVPDLKISIEVNGDYWHSLPGVPEVDFWKFETMINYGFKHHIVWEFEWMKNNLKEKENLEKIINLSVKQFNHLRLCKFPYNFI
jgi:G:T-mismatch repair DNA endonuclease (very short patch repair protein)